MNMHPDHPIAPSRASRHAEAAEGAELGEWLANIWEGRYLLSGFMLAFLLLGGYSVWTSTPTYEASAVLQLQGKREGVSDPAFSKMEGLFSDASEAQAETEILKSNKILGRTVEVTGLDVSISPKYPPIVGRFLAKLRKPAPSLDVERLEVPESLLDKPFSLEALDDGRFQWSSPDGALLGTGRVGETLVATQPEGASRIKIRRLTARHGQAFSVTKRSLNAAIAELGARFDASERGKGTNVIGLTLKDSSPTRGTEILNAIIGQYAQHKLESKTGDASKALSLLQTKLPVVKAELDAAENRLNQFRSSSGTVDLSREADVALQQSQSLSGQITALKQKREELLRTYREDSDVVITLNQQIAKLQGEAGQVDAKMRSLPGTQKEFVRLSRDVEVNTELYTSLLNNIQQLQIAMAGEVANVRVVDPAAPGTRPIGPARSMVVAIYAFLGLLLGGVVHLVRQTLRRVVKDHRQIEFKLGIPIVVTIPHSEEQEEQDRALRQRSAGSHLLTVQVPDSLASESFRSLRTALHLSARDVRNRPILITGPSPAVGKSFVSSNTSVVLAQGGARVLAVDGDLRRGNLHRYFGLTRRQGGLSDVLSGRSPWESVVHHTEVEGLDLITTGTLPPNPLDLLMSPRLAEFVDAVCSEYDFVILDGPPLLPVTDSIVFGSQAGMVLLVAKYGQHPLDELQECQKRLDDHQIEIFGCIFNDIQPVGFGYGYSNYRYAYHYQYK